MFGKFSRDHVTQISTPLPKDVSASTIKPSDSGKATVPVTSPSSGQDITKRSILIPNPSIRSQFDVAQSNPCIACAEQGLAWMRTADNTLQLVDNKGSVKDTMKIDFDISDLALSPNGDIILADASNKCIKSVSKQKKINTLFQTRWKTKGLCCLRNNEIVVAFNTNREVIVYKPNGSIRNTLNLAHIKFSCPEKVSANKINQDIYICDQKNNSTYKGKLIAVRADGKLRYEYSGKDNKPLCPSNVCTDQMGHVLITDYWQSRVHILDQEGQFIQYILTSQQGLRLPTMIDVDTLGNVWVGEYGEQNLIKVAKYLQ